MIVIPTLTVTLPNPFDVCTGSISTSEIGKCYYYMRMVVGRTFLLPSD